jgi:hypothetical protein
MIAFPPFSITNLESFEPLLYLLLNSSLVPQVPSAMHSRTIGYENPATHQLLWFDLAEGPLHFIPDINLYFKLKKID